MAKKGFQFKLEAVLKLRRFEEERARIELGHIQMLVDQKKKEIKNEIDEIDLIYNSRDNDLSSGISGRQITVYPMYLKAKEAKIKELRIELRDLNMALDESNQMWIEARAALKLIEKMKEKQLGEYTKKINKKIDQNLEEEVRIWLSSIQN